MFKKERIRVFGVYQLFSGEPYRVETMVLHNVTNRKAKALMYNKLFNPTKERMGVGHRSIVKIFTEE